MSKIILKLDESMESIVNTTSSGFDANDMTFDDSFIHKVKWSDDEWSMYSSEDATKMDDTMDVFNYRIVEKYTVNKVSANIEPSPIYEVFDESGFDWNAHFISDSSNNGKLIKLEDTLDICNYRCASMECSSSDETPDSTISSYESIVVEYSCKKAGQNVQMADSPKFKHVLSAVDSSEYIWDESIELLDESSIKMEDSMDVYSYRYKSSNLAHQRQVSKTPARCNYVEAMYFNKMVVPKSLFDASSIRHFGPLTSSPVLHSSNRHHSSQAVR